MNEKIWLQIGNSKTISENGRQSVGLASECPRCKHEFQNLVLSTLGVTFKQIYCS